MMKLCCIAILFSAASARTLTRPKSALITPLRWYRVQMATRPALTNCATSALISVASDAVAQSIERRAMRSAAGEGVTAENSVHSYRRSAAMASWGFLMTGFVVMHWFRFMNHLFPFQTLTPAKLLAKVATNQAVCSPVLNALFFGWVILTRESSSADAKLDRWRAKLSADLAPTIARSLVFWSTTNLGIFWFLQPSWHVCGTSVAFFVWTTYVSLVGYRQVAKAPMR